MQDGISFCQFLSASVCIRLQKTVYLHEGKPFTAFPFFMLSYKQGSNMGQNADQKQCYKLSICPISPCEMRHIGGQFAPNCTMNQGKS